jgi:hypothetical protein
MCLAIFGVSLALAFRRALTAQQAGDKIKINVLTCPPQVTVTLDHAKDFAGLWVNDSRHAV